jgi:hypothetical protein
MYETERPVGEAGQSHHGRYLPSYIIYISCISRTIDSHSRIFLLENPQCVY